MLNDFAAELDFNDSGDIGRFYTENGVFRAGANVISGRDAITKFYEGRNDAMAKLQKGGKRTGRHTFLNVRVMIQAEGAATILFTNVDDAGEGAPPVQDCKGDQWSLIAA